MRKNSQRTGIFEIENIDRMQNDSKNENNKPLITAPTIMINVNL